ncbi:MAG: hypothetical protein M3P48_03070 [Actinomycetota bacterium]|nr:hypothetical protein [Actinomycetota bacterium]
MRMTSWRSNSTRSAKAGSTLLEVARAVDDPKEIAVERLLGDLDELEVVEVREVSGHQLGDERGRAEQRPSHRRA